jgi:hypothetical protein
VMTEDSDEQREVRDRVVRQHHPAWCAATYHKHPFDPSAFVDDWDFLTPGSFHGRPQPPIAATTAATRTSSAHLPCAQATCVPFRRSLALRVGHDAPSRW